MGKDLSGASEPEVELEVPPRYHPITKRRRVEISDDSGFRETFRSLNRAANECGISSPSVLKYVLDHGKSQMRRRSDKKVFYVKEVGRLEDVGHIEIQDS